jgi:TonB family protein
MNAARKIKDFPFGLALVFAIVLHTLIGLALHHNFLIAASPLFPSNEPVTVRIVDVPKGGPTLPAPPPTGNLSDANRKAGPLVKTNEPPALRPPPEIRQRAAGGPSTTVTPRSSMPPAASAPNAASLPSIREPTSAPTGQQAEIRTGDAVNQQKLAKSLQNLDRFIAPGSGNGRGSGGGDRDAAGDELQGDQGSGVFFDTRGFDLGPWANRVVAIVKSNWLIPPAADLGVKGVVGVAFEVEKITGKINNVRIISSSNIPSFDQAAVNALTVSSPLPPLPGNFPRPTLAGIFRFYYNLPVPNESR